MYIFITFMRNELCDELDMNIVTSFLRTRIHAILPTHPVVELSDPQLYIELCRLDPRKWNRGSTFYDSNQLSKLIVKMCMNQSEVTLDAEAFDALSGFLTSIDPRVALDLCDLEERYCPDSTDDEDEGLSGGFSSLQERCIDSLSENWKELNGSDIAQVEQMVQRSPEFLSDLLIQSVKKASSEVDNSRRSLRIVKMLRRCR